MKRIIIIIALAVVTLLGASFFLGIIPGLSLLEKGTDTISYSHGDYKGNANTELIGPKAKQGFILSYRDGGFSETITVQGEINWLSGGSGGYGWHKLEKAKYLVYLKKNSYSSYELMSKPGETSMYLSNQNPGLLYNLDMGLAQAYSFEIIGNDYASGSIKVVFQCFYDETIWDQKGSEWHTMSIDEAYLFSGYGELILPRGISDEEIEIPYTSFEIGQKVKIGVGTAKGGYVDNQNPWRVTLNEPYGGSVSNPGDGGGVIFEKYYPNDCDSSNTFFEFTVTRDMALKSMNSPYPYTVRIWNTLLPLGTLQIDFVDFLYKCPGDVIFGGDFNKIQVGEYAKVTLSASVNPETQSEIDYFRVSVVYGTSDTLLPSSSTSERWIIHTTNVGVADKKPCNIPQSISFKPEKESYVTVFAVAVDIQGRASKSTYTRQLWAWEPVADGGSGEPPDDAVDTGDDYYGGGHTEPFLPWDPGGGNWENLDLTEIINLIIKIIIIIIVIVCCIIIAIKVPLPFSPISRILVILVGIIIALMIYFWW